MKPELKQKLPHVLQDNSMRRISCVLTAALFIRSVETIGESVADRLRAQRLQLVAAGARTLVRAV